MKSKVLVMLPLAAALALPTFAQQTATTSQANPPAATADQNQSQASSSDQREMATGKAPLTYETRQGFWGKVNPFARKKYVQRQIQPVQDRVNELDSLTAANSKMIKDVDARAQQGIQLASAKANEADTHAVDAGNRAQQANQTASEANQHLQSVQTVVGNIDQYQAATQVELKFRPGQAILSKKAKDALDDLAGQLKDQKGYIVEVQGFSSGRGTAAVRDSQNMAASVVRYMVENHDIPVYRIYTLGMGNAPRQVSSTDANAKSRRTVGGRVEVSLLKNGIADLNSQMANSSAPAAAPATAAPAASAAPVNPESTPAPASNSNLPQSSEAPAPAAQPATTSQPPASTAPAQPVPPANPPQF